MNKYQRALNKLTKYNMQESTQIKLMHTCNIKNTFRINRKILKIVTKGYSFGELVYLKNYHLRQLKGDR